MSTGRDAIGEAAPGNTGIPQSDANIQGTGSSTIVEIELVQETASGRETIRDIAEVTFTELRPRTRPWLKVSLIAACLCASAVGWWFYRSDSSESAVSRQVASGVDVAEGREAQLQSARYQKLLREERRHSNELEQRLAAHQSDQGLLTQERVRSKELERQLALRQNDRDALVQELLTRERTRGKAFDLAAVGQNERDLLAQERARSKELEQQLAVSQKDREQLVRERARSKELEQQLAASRKDREQLAQERARSKELEQQAAAGQKDRDLLAQERARSKELEQQLAVSQKDRDLLAQERARSKGLEQQVAAGQKDRDLLAQERTRSKGLEQQVAVSQKDRDLLAQERTRSKALEQQLAARQSDGEALAQERTRSEALEHQLATTNLPPSVLDLTLTWPTLAPISPSRPGPAARDTMPMRALAADKAAPAAPVQPPVNPEAARMVARAKLLLDQGDVGAARIELERAAETGSAPALFTLAETYDPAVLSSWGTIGTRSDVRRAQQLYAKAFAGGVQEAKGRLKEWP